MNATSQNALAMLLALLMTASALSGCMGSDEGPVEEEEPEELGGWTVFLVQSSSDLPACDMTTDGRLYYVSMVAGFQTCSNGGWSSIDLTGPAGPGGAMGDQGPAGPQGEKGDQGETGPQGVTGVAGPAGADGTQGDQGEMGPQGPAGRVGTDGADGADGTSFTIIGTVDDTSDLGEIYVGDVGDAFLVNSTVHIFVWSGSQWIDLGDISGPEGPTGPGGTTGATGATGADGQNGADGVDGADGADGADGVDGTQGSMPTVMEMVVTVSSMDFYVDGLQQPEVGLYRGFTYTFDQSDSSNSPHPLGLSTTVDGTHGGGSQYTDGVTYAGTQGSNGLLTFTVPLDAPDTLYYYCQNHAGMGGTVQILSLGYVST